MTKRHIYFMLMSMFLVSFVFGQKTITGTVSDAKTKEALLGVLVMVEGTTIGTTTDINGKYTINAPANAKNLVFSMIGMTSSTQIIGTSTVIDVALSNNETMLKDVVIVGLGIKKDQKKLAYAVTKIDNEDIKRSGEQNTIQALSGKVAGVQVTSSGGVPGASSKIKIRGTNSITRSSEPLIIIDGVPMDNSTEAISAGDNPFNANLSGQNSSNRLIDLNPDDIESMTVLKGPAAAAIYGTEAGNGAIIITTKKGLSKNDNSGKSFKVDYGISSEFSVINGLAKLQNKYGAGSDGEYIPPYNAGPDGLPGTADDIEFGFPQSWGPRLDTTNLPSYNNIKDFFRTGFGVNNNLAISGFTKKLNYRFSFSDYRNKGIIPNSFLNRTTVRLGGDIQITEKLALSATMAYSKTTSNKPENGSNVAGIMLGLYRMPITFEGKNYLNDQGFDNKYFAVYDNPFYSAHENLAKETNDRVQGTASLSYKMHKWFAPTFRVGLDHYTDNRNLRYAVSSNGDLNSTTTGEIVYFNNIYNKINTDIFTQGAGALSKKSKFNFSYLLGVNYYTYSQESRYQRGTGLSQPGFYNLSNTANYYSSESNVAKSKLGIYSDLTFDYNSIVFLNLVGRSDWASTYGNGKKAFNSYAINASWIFSEHLKNPSKIFSFGKLRYSYSGTGIEPELYKAANNYATPSSTDGFTNGVSSPFNGNSAYVLSSLLGNNKLRPERILTHEAGIDLMFLNKRITFGLTYYYKLNKSALIDVRLDPATGFFAQNQNAAKLRNTGIELELGADIIQTKNFTWNSNINWSMNRNKVLELNSSADNVVLEEGFENISAVAKVGYTVGSFYGSKWQRDDKGNMIIGADGLPLVDPNNDIIGNPLPKWLMGWRNTLTYKNISLSFLFDVRYGGDIWNGTYARLNRFGMTKESEDRERTYIVDGVTETGEKNTTEISANDYFSWVRGDAAGTATENAIVKDVKWIRLRDLNLSYTFPKFKYVTNMNLYFTARNLFYKSNYNGVDPETSLTGAGSLIDGFDYFNNPGSKSFIIGLKVGF